VVARVRIPLGAFTAEDPAAFRATMMIFGGIGCDWGVGGGCTLGLL
jgi:hypothetical protein